MITQEEIYRFFETMAVKFRQENLPILNNLVHNYENYPSIEDLEEKVYNLVDQEDEQISFSEGDN